MLTNVVPLAVLSTIIRVILITKNLVIAKIIQTNTNHECCAVQNKQINKKDPLTHAFSKKATNNAIVYYY